MANRFKIKRGSESPNNSADIENYELVYNYTDNELWTKHNGSVVKIASGNVGTVTNVVAGNGLTGGGTTSATLDVGAGTGISIAADSVSTNDSQIVHDSLSGFVANEHIDHSGVSILAGTGLTGGGTIASSRTLNVVGENGLAASANAIGLDLSPLSAVGVNNLEDEDLFAVEIAIGGAIKKLSASSLKTYIGGGTITSVSGMTNHNVLTASGSTTISGESNLTFDGTNLDLPDSKKVRFGTDNDFEFYHDDTNAVINNTKGDLQIYNNADDKDIVLLSDDGSGGTTAYLTLDGSSGYTTVQKLIKFEDSVDARFGTGSNLRIRHDGTNSKIDNYTGTLKIRNTLDDADITLETDNGSGGLTPYITLAGSTGHLNLAPPNNVGIGTASPEGKVHIYNGDANVAPDGDGDELVIENSGDSGISILSGESSTHTGAVIFGSANDAFGAALQYSYHGNKLRLMTANTGHKLEFATDNNTTAMTIDSSQNLGIGTDSPQKNLDITKAGNATFMMKGTGTNNYAGAQLSLFAGTTSDVFNSVMFAMDRATDGVGGIYLQRRDSAHAYKGTLFRYLDTQGWTFSTASSTTATSTADHFYIKPSGNVGIGVVSPAAPLHISNSTDELLKLTSTGANSEIRFSPNTSAFDVRIGATASSANSEFYIETAGTKRLYVDNAGLVGIGETNPTFGLQIDGSNFGGDSLKITRGTSAFTILNANNSYGVLGMESDHDLQIRTDGTTRMTIDNDGKVGIGVLSPTAKLDVRGNVSFFSSDASDYVSFTHSDNGIIINSAGSTSNKMTLNTGGTTALTIDASQIVEIHDDIWCKTNLGAIRFGASKQGNIYENNDDLVFSVQSAGQDMIFENLNSAGSAYVKNLFIDGSAESVGIGTTSPSFKLKVNVDDGSYTNFNTIAGFQSKRSADTEYEVGIAINSGGDALTGSISSNVYFSGTSANKGNTGRSSAELRFSNSANNESEFAFRGQTYNSTTFVDYMKLDNTQSLHVDGDVVAYSTSVSDKRLKDNIRTIDNALDKVIALRGVEFDWNATSRSGQHDIGLIAQEVEEIIPEVVREKKLQTGEFTDNEKTFKTIDYDKMVGVLVEAIKEQQQQINKLEEKLNG